MLSLGEGRRRRPLRSSERDVVRTNQNDHGFSTSRTTRPRRPIFGDLQQHIRDGNNAVRGPCSTHTRTQADIQQICDIIDLVCGSESIEQRPADDSEPPGEHIGDHILKHIETLEHGSTLSRVGKPQLSTFPPPRRRRPGHFLPPCSRNRAGAFREADASARGLLPKAIASAGTSTYTFNVILLSGARNDSCDENASTPAE